LLYSLSALDSPDVIAIGAGPAGLGVTGSLQRRGVRTLILDQAAGVGESWRTRYDCLRLNTMRRLSDLPGYRMERRFGHYPSRDEFVAYLERYAHHEGIMVRFNTPVKRIERADIGWSVILDGETLSAPWIIVATGYDAKPWFPDWPGVADYAGRYLHGAYYRNNVPFADSDVLVVGASNTASDISTDLVRGGAARVRISIRTPPNIFPRKFFGMHAQRGAILGEPLPDISDRVGFFVQRRLYGDLTQYGLPRPRDGMYSHFRYTGHGPMVDEGFVECVKSGAIEVVPAVASFDTADVCLIDGSRIRPDTVIAATGYVRDLEGLVGHLGILAPNGCPIGHGSVCPQETQGLYFIGFVRKMGGQLWPIRAEAKQVAKEISAALKRGIRSDKARQVDRRQQRASIASSEQPSQEAR
jgi:putative flavoprotein involved in K+ transport